MTLIDNKIKTMKEVLANSLTTCDRVDILVGYFYFSGFEELADQLKDKQIRILVGMEIDPIEIPTIVQKSREIEVDFDRYQPRNPTNSHLKLRSNYIDALVGFINDSDIFDNKDTENILDLFLLKISNGTLEIRKTESNEHAKLYILHNKNSLSQNGENPGTIIMGSSNFTYKGLTGQGELNDQFRDLNKFNEYFSKFNELWEKSVSISEKFNNQDFLIEIKNRVWKFALPSPYNMYIRVLDEVFGKINDITVFTPSKITHGQYADLEYQIDAIKLGIDRLNRYDGVILADVVGLGKSIIASAIARNFDKSLTIIIAPPHLISQWEDYKIEFGLRAAKVYSSGKINEVFEKFRDSINPLLIIIDEAHRFRNEETDDYKMLHQITRSNVNNKVLLLTATPFNNAPKDIFALIKLFQIPGRSTLRSVDNLSLRFRQLIERYSKLRNKVTKGESDETYEKKETLEIASEQRKLIENLVIRRSRIDLEMISRYKKDLENQNISFSKVKGPELIQYELNELSELYVFTLNQLVENYKAARYQPTSYGVDLEALKTDFGYTLDIGGLKVGQLNLANHMKRLLVMRFESSKFAFKSTLERMIKTNKIVEDWWNRLGLVPILKKGEIPSPDDFTEDDGELSVDFDKELEQLINQKGLISIPKSYFTNSNEFYNDLVNDTKVLKLIHEKWFNELNIIDIDPKRDKLKIEIDKLIKENSNRKIVVFSSYADTVNYLYNSFSSKSRIVKYTSADPKNIRETIKLNFDASVSISKQLNEFDVLFTTDALSEGVNLHRAGIIINYDIPYNPTRVIQRVGRINRINKKVFDFIYVFNFFPTIIGEAETKLKQISTLKMNLINAIVGSDTRHLTPDEDLQSYFKEQYDEIEKSSNSSSWDSYHIENYELACKDNLLIEQIRKIPRRTRIQRRETKYTGTVIFGKKGADSIFAFGDPNNITNVISVEQALPYFQASKNETSYEVTKDFNNLMALIKDFLFLKNSVPLIKGRRQKAIELLSGIKVLKPELSNYCKDLIKIIKELDDLSDGTLKDLADFNLKEVNTISERLKYLVPENLIQNVLEKTEKMDSAKETILLVEEHKDES